MKLSPTLKDKLRIEAPVNRHNLGIFPLVNAEAPKSAPYLAFGSAHKAGAIRVTEVSEGGSVPQLAVEIIGKRGVLLIDGEELIGARQNRIVNLTILAKGNTQIIIPVSCVERGRWSYVSREFSESPRTMYARGRMKKMMNVSASLKKSGSRVSDQSEVWDEVDQRAAELGSHSRTDAMSDIYGQHAASVEEYMLGNEPLEGQIGAAFAIDGQVVGIELFETQDIAREYLPKVVRSYALDAIARRRVRVSGSTAAADIAAVKQLIEEVCSASSNEFAAVGDGEDMRLDSSTVTGSALLKEGVVIHLSAFRKVLADISEPPKSGGLPRLDSSERGRAARRDNPELGITGLLPVGRRPRRADDSEAENHPLEIVRDHVMIRIHGKLALVDTGSPVSIGRGADIILEGREWTPSSANSLVLDAVDNHLQMEVEWLLGADILCRHRMLLDWPAGIVQLGRARTREVIDRFKMESVMGIPVIEARYNRRKIKGVLDSGAALSYAPRAAVEALPPSGEFRDFYPGAGAFTTPTWDLPVKFGTRKATIRVGVLPDMLQMLFGMLMGPDGWIFGSAFFRDRAMLLDYRWKHVLDLTSQEETD